MVKPKQDDKAQSKRFIEKAKKVANDDAEEKFEHAFTKVIPPKRPGRENPPKKDQRQEPRRRSS